MSCLRCLVYWVLAVRAEFLSMVLMECFVCRMRVGMMFVGSCCCRRVWYLEWRVVCDGVW